MLVCATVAQEKQHGASIEIASSLQGGSKRGQGDKRLTLTIDPAAILEGLDDPDAILSGEKLINKPFTGRGSHLGYLGRIFVRIIPCLGTIAIFHHLLLLRSAAQPHLLRALSIVNWTRMNGCDITSLITEDLAKRDAVRSEPQEVPAKAGDSEQDPAMLNRVDRSNGVTELQIFNAPVTVTVSHDLSSVKKPNDPKGFFEEVESIKRIVELSMARTPEEKREAKLRAVQRVRQSNNDFYDKKTNLRPKQQDLQQPELVQKRSNFISRAKNRAMSFLLVVFCLSPRHN
ncbi:hypothetical protein B0H13DRAFT_1898022 [Mycena leptocephala]|nr:hypothetical protein B0H13DRAFT_1898022 [Mycena leptocephala]